MRQPRAPFWLRRLFGKLRSPAATRAEALRHAIADVEVLFAAKGHLLVEGPGHERYVLATYADDLSARLRQLAAELRAAARRLPRYQRRHRGLGLPSLDAIDDAAARLVAMADYLSTGQARHNGHLRREVEQFLGIAPSASAPDEHPG